MNIPVNPVSWEECLRYIYIYKYTCKHSQLVEMHDQVGEINIPVNPFKWDHHPYICTEKHSQISSWDIYTYR